MAINVSQAALISQPYGERFRARRREPCSNCAERASAAYRSQRRSMACSSVVRSVGRWVRGLQRLFPAPHGFPVGRPGMRPGPSLSAVPEGFIPHLAPQGVLGQALHLLVLPVTSQRFERVDNLGMQGLAPLLEQTPIRHFVGEHA